MKSQFQNLQTTFLKIKNNIEVNLNRDKIIQKQILNI